MVRIIEYDLKMDLKNKDFLYIGIDIDYKRDYNCSSYGCDSEGICRCSSIYDEQIININVSEIVENIYNQIYDNSKATKRNNLINSLFGISKELEIYTIDRILRKSLIYDESIWEIEIEGGYYGQEIGSVKLDSTYADKLSQKINESIVIDNVKNRVEYLLNLEYGYILPELLDKDYRVITINKSDIVFGNEKHLKNVSTKDLDFYSDTNYDGIRGVVTKKDGKYKVIDGYHRLSKTSKKSVMVIEAY
jgi:hypothetical protein